MQKGIEGATHTNRTLFHIQEYYFQNIFVDKIVRKAVENEINRKLKKLQFF